MYRIDTLKRKKNTRSHTSVKYDAAYLGHIISFLLSQEDSKQGNTSRPDQQCTTVSPHTKGMLYQAYAANVLGFLYWMNDMEDKINKFTWESGPGVFRSYILWWGFSQRHWLHKANRRYMEKKGGSTIPKTPLCLLGLVWYSSFCLFNVFSSVHTSYKYILGPLLCSLSASKGSSLYMSGRKYYSFLLDNLIFSPDVSVREIIHSYAGKMPYEASQEGSFFYNALCFITLWQAKHVLWLLFSLLHHCTDRGEKKLFR